MEKILDWKHDNGIENKNRELETINLDCKQSSKVGNSESRDWKDKNMIGNKLGWKHKKFIGFFDIYNALILIMKRYLKYTTINS